MERDRLAAVLVKLDEHLLREELEILQLGGFELDEFAESSDAGLEGHDELLLFDFVRVVEVEHLVDELQLGDKLFAAEDDLGYEEGSVPGLRDFRRCRLGPRWSGCFREGGKPARSNSLGCPQRHRSTHQD